MPLYVVGNAGRMDGDEQRSIRERNFNNLNTLSSGLHIYTSVNNTSCTTNEISSHCGGNNQWKKKLHGCSDHIPKQFKGEKMISSSLDDFKLPFMASDVRFLHSHR